MKKWKLTCQADFLKVLRSHENGLDDIIVLLFVAGRGELGQLSEVDNGEAIRTLRLQELLCRRCRSKSRGVLAQMDQFTWKRGSRRHNIFLSEIDVLNMEMVKTRAMDEVGGGEILDRAQFEIAQCWKPHKMEKRGTHLGHPFELACQVVPNSEGLQFRQPAQGARDGEHDVVITGDAIIKFADIFCDFGVALDEVHERVYAGRGVCGERVVDLNRGENVFPGKREEGAGDEGACTHGGELFIVHARLSRISP